MSAKKTNYKQTVDNNYLNKYNETISKIKGKPMRIAICEDDPTQLMLIQKNINNWANERDKNITLASFKSAESYLFKAENEKPYDVLLLDIQMDKMSGFELARKIREKKSDIIIIFITALKEYVYQGYNVEALGYILKPIDWVKLFECMDRAAEKLSSKENSYIVIENQKINKNDILYVEAISHYIIVYTKTTDVKLKGPLSKVMEELDCDSIIKCHRSYAVNLEAVAKILKDEAVLDNGKTVPISRSKYKEVNSAFIKHFKERIL